MQIFGKTKFFTFIWSRYNFSYKRLPKSRFSKTHPCARKDFGQGDETDVKQLWAKTQVNQNDMFYYCFGFEVTATEGEWVHWAGAPSSSLVFVGLLIIATYWPCVLVLAFVVNLCVLNWFCRNRRNPMHILVWPWRTGRQIHLQKTFSSSLRWSKVSTQQPIWTGLCCCSQEDACF